MTCTCKWNFDCKTCNLSMNTKSFIQLNDANNNNCSQPLLNYIFFSKGSGMILLFVHCIPLQPQNSLSGNPTQKLYAQWHHTAFNFSLFFCLPLLPQASQCFFKRQYTAFVILTFLFCYLSFFLSPCQVCKGFYACARDPDIWKLACLRYMYIVD